jgi:Trypsin-like peptidase domain
MKVLAAVVLLVALLFPSTAQAQEATPNFRETLSAATLAVYMGKQVCEYRQVQTVFGAFPEWGCEFKEQFVCTATVVASDLGGQFTGLTAGHCFSYEAEKEKIDYFVADNVGTKPVLHKIKLIKFENDDRYDYAVFSFQSLVNYPVITVYQGDGIPPVGTRVVNVNFSLGITKEIVDGPIVSKEIGETESADSPRMRRRYFVQIPFGPGASGSAIVEENSQQIVGLTEMMFPGTQMAAVVIPVGHNLVNFMQDDSAGIKPEVEPKKAVKSPEAPSKLKTVIMTFLGWVLTQMI